MINSDETIIDQGIHNNINASETILDEMPGSMDSLKNASDEESFTLSVGSMLGDFRIVKLLAKGAQAKVYIVERGGERFAAKVYGRRWQPVKTLRVFFSTNQHDNVMRVVDSGRELSMYYEVYPYYEHGTLEDYVRENGTLSVDFIKKYVVPSVNEGIHHLHVNNIVHCDIKPSNLYLDKCGDDWKVVIGDLGSCRVMDSDGMVRASLHGTINFSVPVEDFYGVKTFPKEYDYVSFGMTLYRLYTDTNLMEGLDINERARLWERVSVIPVDDIRLRNLLSGLINKDFGSVWGYDELKRWSLSGWNSDKKRRPVRERTTDVKTKPMIFGKVDGEIIRVTNIHGLVEACKSNWTLAHTVMKRFDTLQFIRQFDAELFKKVSTEIRDSRQNENIVLFRVLYMMEKSNSICYKGRDMGDLNGFLEILGKRDEDAIEFVTFDLLTYYMEIMGADQDDIARLDELVKLNRLNALGTLGMIEGIRSAFMKNDSLTIDGKSVDSMNSFVDCIAKKSSKEIAGVLEREDVLGWLASMGYSKEIEKL